MSIIILFSLVTIAVAQVCEYENSVELKNRTYDGITFDEGEYIVDNKTKTERGCICMKKICIRKCCPFGQGYRDKSLCVDLQEPFDPPAWQDHQVRIGFSAMKGSHVLINRPNCATEDNEFRILIRDFTVKHHMQTDGKYYFMDEDQGYKVYEMDKFCVDNFIIEKENNKTEVHLMSLICYQAALEDRSKFDVSSTCMLISCFFMVLTIAVYTILPELRTLHGMVLITYLLCFFVGFLCMAIMQLMLKWQIIYSDACLNLTFVIYFALLAAFFWLNVLCYNLWTKLRLHTHVLTKTVRYRYLSYCAYAFGMPTILTTLVAILEFYISSEDSIYLPNIRLQGCFLNGMSKFIYLYLPMMTICAANLVLFILMAIRISEIKRTQQLKMKHSQRFILYIELFVVTGLSWIFEVISSFYPDINYVWKFTDAYNCLVGLLIFIIFVCKRKVLTLIKKRCKRQVDQAVSRKQSSTSSKSLSRSREQIPMNISTLLESGDENK